MPAFARTIGIDYSGAETPTASLKGLRVYLAEGRAMPTEVPPPPSSRKYWTRRGIAEWLVERVQQVRSHESELLQIADLLIGALTYANRGLATSPAKTAMIDRLRATLGQQALSRTSTFAATKFNILVWRAQGATG